MNDNNVNKCPYLSYRKDCDGDYDAYCTKSGSCPYQMNVKDCDGDIVVLCRE